LTNKYKAKDLYPKNNYSQLLKKTYSLLCRHYRLLNGHYFIWKTGFLYQTLTKQYYKQLIMKKLLIALSLVFGFTALHAQKCSYMVLSAGAEIEMTHYDKGGDESMKSITKVLSSTGGEAKVAIKMLSKKGKELTKAQGTYRCRGDIFSFDLQMMLPPQQMEGMKDMEIKATPAELEFPSNMVVGSTLKDASMTIESYMNGMKLMTMSFAITNRKVESKESITTPAGTYDCFKISDNIKMKSVMNMDMRSTTWFAPGVGMIKTESYRGDKLMGTTMLTKVTK
jgi:hypothetical protein